MIAALFVRTNGPYWGMPDVDPWDEKRDARKYAGPYPVVAHPPCSRWCRLAGLVEARWGHKRGDDVRESQAVVSWCGNHTSKFDKRPRLGTRAASQTPPAFRDVLIGIARSAGRKS